MRDATSTVLVCPDCDGLFTGTHDLDWHLYNDHLFGHTNRFFWSLRRDKIAPAEQVRELDEARRRAIESGSAGDGDAGTFTPPRHPRPTPGQRIAIRLMRT